MKIEGDKINLELKSQVLTIREAKSLWFYLNCALDEMETEAACNRQLKGTMLFAKRFEKDRIRLFNEVKPLFNRLFNKYRGYGYHPRDIKTVILDVLDTEAGVHRQLHYYDQRAEAPDEKE